jgi:NADPH:quinone reductase
MHQEASEKASFDVCAPFVPGSNFVGIVHHCTRDATETYGLQAGTRVASIIKWGANARYVTVPPQHLITVPEDLDAADIASLISFYLPAFQALHHGRLRPTRYSFSCLRGKRVLVLADGATLEVQALVRLAKLAGASEVFVAVPREHHAVLKNRRIAALSDNPRDWLPVVQNSMDVVVDYSFPKHFSEVRQSLGPKGRLICSPQARPRGSGLLSFGCAPGIKLDFLLERYQLSMMKRANLFDFKEYVEQFRDFVFEDMTFLFSLLSTRKIRPQVDRFITLDYIPKAHQEIRSNVPQEGAIICEPWKK